MHPQGTETMIEGIGLFSEGAGLAIEGIGGA